MNQLFKYFKGNKGRLIYKWHDYFDIYHRHFERYRGKPVTVLEIGVWHGGSLQMWKKYFGRKAKIYGVDVNPYCKTFEEKQIEIIIGDQSDREFLKQLREQIGQVDIIIDDGSHHCAHQIATFQELYTMIADDGVYLVEDLHTSYWPEYEGGYHREGTFIEFSKMLIDSLNAWHIPNTKPDAITISTDSLHYYDSVLVIEKRRKQARSDVSMTGIPSF